MSFEFDATYRDGAIQPDVPLNLPNNTPVHVTVATKPSAPRRTGDEIVARRPKSPRITPEEFRALIANHAVHVGTLPPDFSREDIYSDHD
ncbi:MAG TPA: hypothetical protein PJ982_15550 [Lacipirellulaceae bacterium]|nr:hypothetical protein [Lacipirellulaceae bacterium]